MKKQLVLFVLWSCSVAFAAVPAFDNNLISVKVDGTTIASGYAVSLIYENGSSTFHMWYRTSAGTIDGINHAISTDGHNFTTTGSLSFSNNPFPAGTPPYLYYENVAKLGARYLIFHWTYNGGAGSYPLYDYNISVSDIGTDPNNLSVKHLGPVGGGTYGQTAGPFGMVSANLYCQGGPLGQSLCRGPYTNGTPPSVSSLALTDFSSLFTANANTGGYINNHGDVIQIDSDLGLFFTMRDSSGNRFNQQVYFSSSIDGGVTWAPAAQLFTSPTLDGAALIYNFAHPDAVAVGNNVFLYLSTQDADGDYVVAETDARPDLTITKTDSGGFYSGKTGATYTITVTNSGVGPTDGSTVKVVETLPTGVTATAISGTGWKCNLGTVTCTRKNVLADGNSYPVITVTVNVASNAPASVTNTAVVSGGGEMNTSNDTATDITAVTQKPDLAITKTHTGLFAQGQTGKYTIVVSNPANVASSGTVTVTDTLPTSLEKLTLSGAGWTCNLSTLTCSRSDALAGGANYPPITLVVLAVAGGTVTNTATVAGGGELNTANDTATDPTLILGQVAVTITANKSGLKVLVDGSYVEAPHTFYWYVGAMHTISAPSPQGTHVFQSWSDGGARTHNITVISTGGTYTATYN